MGVPPHLRRLVDRRVSRRLGVLLGALVCAACASTNLAPIGAGEAPFRPERDERSLWAEADAFDRLLERNGLVYETPAIEAYLEGVAKALLPARPPGAPQPRIRVLREPSRNAFALPNGSVYLHTGILARIDNEAQLAALLGHIRQK